MTVWFTSDTHFGHGNIIKYSNRPFKDVAEMDEMLIKNWNSAVQPNDRVYHTGDFSFHRPDKSREIVRRLNGQKYLIKGNHDRDNILSACADQFVWIKDYHALTIDGQRIIMCHFPFLTWDKSHHGSWNLHGHCHGSLPDDPHALRIDIGVDCHEYAPISLERIRELMKKKSFKPIDHHGRAD